MLSSIINFFKYWYFRYLLVTELYMVEKWERVMFHGVVAIVFTIISLFNSRFMLTLVSPITASLDVASNYFKDLIVDSPSVEL